MRIYWKSWGGGGAKSQGLGAALGPGQSPGWAHGAKPMNRSFNKEQYTKTIYKPIKWSTNQLPNIWNTTLNCHCLINVLINKLINNLWQKGFFKTGFITNLFIKNVSDLVSSSHTGRSLWIGITLRLSYNENIYMFFNSWGTSYNFLTALPQCDTLVL